MLALLLFAISCLLCDEMHGGLILLVHCILFLSWSNWSAGKGLIFLHQDMGIGSWGFFGGGGNFRQRSSLIFILVCVGWPKSGRSTKSLFHQFCRILSAHLGCFSFKILLCILSMLAYLCIGVFVLFRVGFFFWLVSGSLGLSRV
jgi:hypothetical protein